MTTEPGTHIYCINLHAKNAPFAKMVVIQTLHVHGHEGLLCKPEGSNTEPRFFSKDTIALTVGQAEKLQDPASCVATEAH